MKYICGYNMPYKQLNIVIIQAHSIEDLFWQLDEVGNPFNYIITKRPFKGMISLLFNLEEDDSYEVTEVEDTASLISICDDFINNKNKYEIIKKNHKFSLKRIKK